MDSVDPKVIAAVNKRAKKPKDPKKPYYLWIGGGGIAFVVLVLAYMWGDGPAAPVKETRSIADIAVNDEILVDKINGLDLGWSADSQPFFEGFNLKTVKNLGGAEWDDRVYIRSCRVGKVALRRSFDARTQWPMCFKGAIVNQGNCSSSYAVSAASSMANRFCVSDTDSNTKVTMSAQELLSCDGTNKGCKGGSLHGPFKYMENSGLVSEKCFPYKGADGECSEKCSDAEPLQSKGHCLLNSMGNIMAEIQLNGPVVGLVPLTKDFFLYKSGVYAHNSQVSRPLTDRKTRKRLMHAVKIIGWGVEPETNTGYWIIENSWGAEWGEKGYGKILRASDDSGVLMESHVIAGLTEPMPEVPKPPPKDDDAELDQLDDDDDEEDEVGDDDDDDEDEDADDNSV